jgi:geranyl-CoA carboxylase alpha subunit
VRALTTGRVVAVGVRPGERVQAGQVLLTLEAMKMQHGHAAPHAGVVMGVHVAVGDQVVAGRVLAEVGADAPVAAAGEGPSRG